MCIRDRPETKKIVEQLTGIKYENVPAVNEYLEQYIKEVDACLLYTSRCV